ncbi:MAG TPA: hypothetical protein VMV02_03085 [Acidimicrobiales bacterium]|nr:hypothetical protein [Acidimicrobiales bacterium]
MSASRRRRDAARLDALEHALDALGHEVRTRRLAVLGPDGAERVVAEVASGHAEVRVAVPGGPHGRASCVLVFATPASAEIGEGVGVQLWGDGDAIVELCAWRSDGRWEPEVRRQPGASPGAT